VWGSKLLVTEEDKGCVSRSGFSGFVRDDGRRFVCVESPWFAFSAIERAEVGLCVVAVVNFLPHAIEATK
jgi:hypothetical protein